MKILYSLITLLLCSALLFSCAGEKTPSGDTEASAKYTLTFSGGDGAEGDAPEKITATAGEKITLPKNTFTKKSHKFLGWNDGTKNYHEGAPYTMENKDITMNAVWEPTYEGGKDEIEGFGTYSGKFSLSGKSPISKAVNSLALSKNNTLTEGTVTAWVTIPQTGSVGVVFGSDENAKSYYRYTVSSNLSVSLEEVRYGFAKTLKETSLVAKYAKGANVELKVIFDGEMIYTYIDKVCLVAYSAKISNGGLGIYASESGMTFKTFKADSAHKPIKADLVLWGHSHMQLWNNYKSDLNGYGTVINMGIGGSNTPYWEKLIDEICSYGASKMIVMTGSNDISYTAPNDIMALEDKIYKELKKRIPDLEIYLITEFLQPCRLEFTDKVHTLNALYYSYADENSFVKIVDAYDIAINADGSLNQNMFIDIYHLTTEGYNILKGRVRDALDGK